MTVIPGSLRSHVGDPVFGPQDRPTSRCSPWPGSPSRRGLLAVRGGTRVVSVWLFAGLANSTRLPPIAASILPPRSSTKAAGALRARFASGDPASTPRQAQVKPWGNFVKYVLKSTSHRLSTGSKARDSTTRVRLPCPARRSGTPVDADRRETIPQALPPSQRRP